MSPEVEFCEFAANLVKMIKPELVLETGVGQGYVTRRMAAELGEGQALLCFESDDNLRKDLRNLDFFSGTNHLASAPYPDARDFAIADFTLLDSDFSLRFHELETWWKNAKTGSVVLVHDCGNGHTEETGHAQLAAFIHQLGITGVFLKNPRGSFLGIKG